MKFGETFTALYPGAKLSVNYVVTRKLENGHFILSPVRPSSPPKPPSDEKGKR